VIKEGEHVLENQMTGKVKDRFRKLLDLLPFESCIEYPLTLMEKLIAPVSVSSSPNIFNRYHLRMLWLPVLYFGT